MPLDQFLERALIPRRRALHEFGILGRHHSGRALPVTSRVRKL